MAELQDIIERAEKLFFSYGVKSVSMDDLSRDMSISKKTLYNFIDNKDEIVYLVVQNHINREKSKSEAVIHHSVNAIDEFLKIVSNNQSELNSINKNVLFDLQKYHPKSWNLLLEFTEVYIYNHILHNINRGIREELYRSDLNPELIAFIYVRSIDAILKQPFQHQTNYSLANTLKEFTFYHLHGIISKNGKEYLQHIITNYENI